MVAQPEGGSIVTIAAAIFMTGSQSGVVESVTSTSPGWKLASPRASAMTRVSSRSRSGISTVEPAG